MKITRFFNIIALSIALSFLLMFMGSCKPQRTISSPDSIGTENNEPISNEPISVEVKNAIESDDVAVEKETMAEEESGSILNLRNFAMQRDVSSILDKSSIFSSHFTGFSLFDISRNEFVVDYNARKNFTPASNVKVLTLYAALRSFGNRLPGMLYRETNDTLFLRPIGDPTLLNQYFSNQPVIARIKLTGKPVAVEWPKKNLDRFGIGWMWDDYAYGFQPELSWMPIYGNVVRFEYNKTTLKATPGLFDDLVEISWGTGERNTVRRSANYNYFDAKIRFRNWAFEKNVPFKYSQALTTKLLSDATQVPVTIIPERKLKMDTLYSQPMDAVLRRLMQESDNFIAEQLLIMAAWKNGFDNTEAFREYMIANWLSGMEPIWMDGSGISRYNLIKPADEVLLLRKIYNEFGWDLIDDLFAKGGISGTLKGWYPSKSNPREAYIIAKTGTLSNNYTLSGFLKTKSGKLLIFSFMNNNYTRKTDTIKGAMQQFLEKIRDSYE